MLQNEVIWKHILGSKEFLVYILSDNFSSIISLLQMHPLSCPFEFRVELALPFQISLVTAVILGIGGVDIGMVVAAVAVCSF